MTTKFKGHIGVQWTDWFGGLTITLEDDGDTLLTGPVVDQAALHGLLKEVRDLGMGRINRSLTDAIRWNRWLRSTGMWTKDIKREM
ncbi:MAG: hypothetical protein WA125_13495 [Desulfosporosinus sp.]